MGVRVSVEVLDLLRAGCIIRSSVTRHPADEQYPAHDEELLHVTFPCGTLRTFDFDTCCDKLLATCDYNAWGSNRPVLAPLFEALKIAHEVV